MTAVCLQPITPWCFKTFYLTAAPSYHQLQQLVAEHAQQLLAAQQELGPLPSAAAADTEWFNPGCDRMTRLTGISSCSTISSMADQAAQQAEGQERGSADEEDPHCSASSRRDPAQPAAAPPPPAAAADAGHGTCHAATVRQGQERRKPPPPFLHAPAADATHTAAPSSTCSHPAVADGDASLGHRVTQVRLHQPRLISLYVSDNLFEGSTGCHEWEAGFVLGEWLVANHHLLAGEGRAGEVVAGKRVGGSKRVRRRGAGKRVGGPIGVCKEAQAERNLQHGMECVVGWSQVVAVWAGALRAGHVACCMAGVPVVLC
jgi:hypothetical protein